MSLRTQEFEYVKNNNESKLVYGLPRTGNGLTGNVSSTNGKHNNIPDFIKINYIYIYIYIYT